MLNLCTGLKITFCLFLLKNISLILIVNMHMILVASKKANIFFQDIKQIIRKSNFNILALNYGQKFLRKLNVYLTYLLKIYIKTIYLICMNYLMHDCLFIYLFFSFLFNFYSIHLFINFFFSTTILVSDAGILFYLFCFMVFF